MFDLDHLKNNISSYDEDYLCFFIVAQRFLYLDKQITIECMKELAIRRSNGSTFNFEQVIEQHTKDFKENEIQNSNMFKI